MFVVAALDSACSAGCISLRNLSGADARELRQRLIQREELDDPARADIDRAVFVEVCLVRTAAALLGVHGPGVIDEDAPHHLRGERIELLPVIELRYFAGLNLEEISGLLGVSPATISRDQRSAEAWLSHVMSDRIA